MNKADIYKAGLNKPQLLTSAALRRFPLPALDQAADKDTRGQVLAVAGSLRAPGAALLAGVAALRAGAGKLQLALPRGLCAAAGFALPEAGLVPLPDNARGDPKPASALDHAARSADAILIGPGLIDPRSTSDLVRACVRACKDGRFVLDAAALVNPHKNLQGLNAAHVVVTPHYREMAALLDCNLHDIERDPLGAAQTAARTFHCTVVLKGDRTFIVSPTLHGSVAWRHDGGTAGLATSGSGDVLAGMLAGLLARGADTLTAALWAVWIHGQAGHKLSSAIGPTGFLARELLAVIPPLLGKPRAQKPSASRA